MTEKTKKHFCPYCKAFTIEEHGTEPGDFNWWLCRQCGRSWPVPKEKQNGNSTADS